MAARLISVIKGKHVVEFDQGGIDTWCVYLKKDQTMGIAPRDAEYFAILETLGAKHGYQKIYDDFVKVYRATGKLVERSTLGLIATLALDYDSDAEEIEIWFTVIYAGMIAEENKEFTKLGKRLKRLGMYQTLIERLGAEVAANFSRGKQWRELDKIMLEKGF